MNSGSETLDRIARSREAVFATDPSDRVVLWNRGCEALLGRTARAVLGRKCYDVLRGQDDYGNLYCHQSCPVAFQVREQVPVNRFVLNIEVGEVRRDFWVAMFAIPSFHPALSTIVHVLRDRKKETESRLERELAVEAAIQEPLWQMTIGSAERSALTKREEQVLQCLAKGLSTTLISSQLVISAVTVRNHVSNILHKLHVHTKLAAVAFAHQNNLI